MSTEFRLKPYLTRIGFEGAEAPDLATLKALHACHVKAIPFESFDPLLGRPVQLGLGALQGKLVDSRRGGYCFEQNTLLATALHALGFEVTLLAARVRFGATRVLPRTHMVLKVASEDAEWLADVGFGAAGTVADQAESDYHYGVIPQTLLGLRLIFGERAMLEASGRQYYVIGTGSGPESSTSDFGAETIVHFEVISGVPFTARLSPRTTVRAGRPVKLAVDVDRLHLFDPASGRSLR